MPVARRAVVHGRVQGVFFRDTIRRAAAQRGVAGWAANRHDGTVEVWLEGEPEAVQSMLRVLHDGPPRAKVERVDVDDVEPAGPRQVRRSLSAQLQGLSLELRSASSRGSTRRGTRTVGVPPRVRDRHDVVGIARVVAARCGQVGRAVGGEVVADDAVRGATDAPDLARRGVDGLGVAVSWPPNSASRRVPSADHQTGDSPVSRNGILVV